MLNTPTGEVRREREGAAEREEAREREEVREEREALKVAYQNVGRGIEATNILLDRGRQENWDLVFVAEAWQGRKGERTIQQGYRIFYQEGSSISLYVREEVDLHQLGAKIETSQNWIKLGDIITGVYLSPSLNMEPLREALTQLPTTDNIIGDLNCTQRYRRRALLEKMTARNLTEISIKANTWRRWHQPQYRWVESKPDVVFSIGNWTQGASEWTISDHSIITDTIPSQLRKRKLLVTDWNFWTDFTEDKENNADTVYSDPIGELKSMARENLKVKKYNPKP